MKGENPSGKSLIRTVFQKSCWGCPVEGRLFGEVGDIGDRDSLGDHSNRPQTRGENAWTKAVAVGTERNEQIQKILGQRCSDLEQTPAISPFVVATDRGTNFLNCEDGEMPASHSNSREKNK